MGEDVLNCSPDRISNLPVEVKDTILTFLPLREAVRTSALSTNWRYSWINLSKVIFDDTTCQFSKDIGLHARCKLISTINQILLLHDGPILEFSLSHSVLESCPEIDHFTLFLSKKSVHEFCLKILKGKEHKLHSSFFSCQELTHMNLYNCIFTPPPAFKGFPRLVSVKFENAVLSTDIFGNLVTMFPQLESLTLINPPKFHCLTISAPKLKYLHVKGTGEFLRFGDVPLLQSATFAMNGLSAVVTDTETSRLDEFFSCLPSLKKLVANNLLLRHLALGGGVPKKLRTAACLETLELSSLSFYNIYEVCSLFCLISSCPSIQRIEIKISDCCNIILVGIVNGILNFVKKNYCPGNVILVELREVHLMGVSGKEPELELIKILLAKSPALKTMLIETKKKDDFSRLELLKKLTRFQRASPMAEIIYE